MNPKLRSWLIGVLVVAAVVALFVAAHRHRNGGNRAPNGGPSFAPDFSLLDLSGSTVRLSSYRGRIVLLDFWATWCEPCREETPHFVDFQNKYGSQGLQILGVSMDDSPEPVRDFAQKFQINYPVVMGTAKTGQLYGGILGLPVAYLIDREGHIRSRHIGATQPEVFEKEISDLLKESSQKQ
jgi:peroxiredoxin